MAEFLTRLAMMWPIDRRVWVQDAAGPTPSPTTSRSELPSLDHRRSPDDHRSKPPLGPAAVRTATLRHALADPEVPPPSANCPLSGSFPSLLLCHLRRATLLPHGATTSEGQGGYEPGIGNANPNASKASMTKVRYVPILTPTNLPWNLNRDPVGLTGSKTS